MARITNRSSKGVLIVVPAIVIALSGCSNRSESTPAPSPSPAAVAAPKDAPPPPTTLPPPPADDHGDQVRKSFQGLLASLVQAPDDADGARIEQGIDLIQQQQKVALDHGVTGIEALTGFGAAFKAVRAQVVAAENSAKTAPPAKKAAAQAALKAMQEQQVIALVALKTQAAAALVQLGGPDLSASLDAGAPTATAGGPDAGQDDGEEYKDIDDDGACPAGLWSLFPSWTKGADEFARRDANRQRRNIAKKVLAPGYDSTVGIEIGEYDFKRQGYPLTIKPQVTCHVREDDVDGHEVVVAITPAKVVEQREDFDPANTVEGFAWQATPLKLLLPIKEPEAKAFRERIGNTGLTAIAAYNLTNKVQIHKRVLRMRRPDMPSDYVDKDDLGAGPMVQAKLLFVQVKAGEETLLDTFNNKRH